MIPLGMLGAARPRASGGGIYTTLNPSDKSSGVTLSGGDLVASAPATSAGLARSVHTITGKRYFEAVYTTVPGGSATIAAGVATSAAALADSLGYSTATGWAFWGQSVGARHAGSTAISGSASSGDVFGFAVDKSTGRLWIHKNGTWIKGNPATNTSPIWSNLTGTLHAAACPWDEGASITMRFDPATFSHAAPTGFNPILA